MRIAANGAWQGSTGLAHYHDVPLSMRLGAFFQSATVGDFGCGNGCYVRDLRNRGIDIKGFDGNPHTPLLEPSCEVLDLSKSVSVEIFDWALSLEVGEHLPAEYESVFIDNLHRHNRCGIVLSWAIVGQPGDGHVNCRSNDYIRSRVAPLGYTSDLVTEQRLRAAATLPWFKNTLMVFRRVTR